MNHYRLFLSLDRQFFRNWIRFEPTMALTNEYL
jgi:hypothetical protein